jgi:ribosomal protein L17
VRRAIDANEITWFPLNKAIRLEQAASAEEALLHDLKKTVVKSETGIATTLDKFQTNINIVLEQLNQALKQDHIQERVESRAATRKARRPSLTTENLRGESQKRPGSAAGQGKTLILELLEITNLNIPANQPFDRLICNVTIGSTFQTIPCNPLSKANNLTFGGENKFRLLDGVQAGDERSVTVQLMKEVSNPFSLLELQAVQIPVNDLLLAEGAVLEVFFTLPGVEEASKLCVFPTCVGTFV